MKIFEDIVEQHPKGLNLAGKLCQLDKTRRFCDFLAGSDSSLNSTSTQNRIELGATSMRAASATASQEALTESKPEYYAVSKIDNKRVDNNSDSDFNTHPSIVIIATPHGRIDVGENLRQALRETTLLHQG